MKNTLLGMLVLLMVLLTGCVQPKPIEELGIINTRGVDIMENDKIETTLVFLKFNSRDQNISKTITGVGNTIKNARNKANFKSNFQLTPGQIRLEIYGKTTAEKGLLRYLDTLIRDARVSDTMYLTVSATTANEIITSTQNQESGMNIGKFLHDLIERNIKDDTIPRVTLQDFVHMFYDKGQDPYLPILSIKDDAPAITAMAIFQGDKLVGQISLDETLLLNLYNKTFNVAPLEISLPQKPFDKFQRKSNQDGHAEDNFYIVMTVINGESKTKMVDVQNLKFQTNINLDVSLLELTEDINIKNPKVIKLFEKEIEKDIKQQYEKLLSKLQEMNADPFGYGNIYRTKKPSGNLTDSDWRDKFPTIKVDFKVNVRILHHGTTP
ncbi:Ger(x)C family spore germination protein [Virgibacillus oceani]|uniref:Uncharacterized protein n=1 Tax=Virgibacillus oceani TaxID=1479511 RepID=A0A917HPP8_9BACI|nr:Ger(x)C family spore germination protein [Virgibacillus oceani]GGG85300.1 hypothetical protein GCM10011398_33790 [Virgibacillus oceani]